MESQRITRIVRELGFAVALAGWVALASGLVLLYQPRWLVAALAARSPEVLYFLETDRRVVALTIDDGPDPATTPRILRVLARHGARATFFLISDRAEPHAPLVARIAAEGHELGNHLTQDRTSIRLSAREFEAALMEADRVLSRFGPVRWFRPGGGWYDEEMLTIAARHGYRCALGSIYPYDVAIPWSGFAAFHVLRKVRPGSVIILHDGGGRGRRTVEVLRRVLPELERRGYEVRTLSEIVGSAR